MKNKKKSKWQAKREKEAEQNSQFDPKIHQLGREGPLPLSLLSLCLSVTPLPPAGGGS